MIVSIDPGARMGWALWTEARRYHSSGALHYDSLVGLATRFDMEVEQWGRITTAYIEDQYHRSSRIITLAHMAGVVVSSLVRIGGCKVVHWRQPSKWKPAMRGREAAALRSLGIPSWVEENERDAILIGIEAGMMPKRARGYA